MKSSMYLPSVMSLAEISPLTYRRTSTIEREIDSVGWVNTLMLAATFSPVVGSAASVMIPQKPVLLGE